MQTDVKVPNFAKLVGDLKGLNKDIDKAISRTISDCKTRGPAQVTKAVTAVYGIKSREVTEAGKDAKRGVKTIGRIKVKGVTVDSVQIIYSGRRLTPIHFPMTPRKSPDGRQSIYTKAPGMLIGKGSPVAMINPPKPYKIKVNFFKEKKSVLRSDAFLAPVKRGSSTFIPFYRTGKNKTEVKSVRTLGIPQMITNEKVADDIQARLDDLLVTRLQHNAERIAKK